MLCLQPVTTLATPHCQPHVTSQLTPVTLPPQGALFWFWDPNYTTVVGEEGVDPLVPIPPSGNVVQNNGSTIECVGLTACIGLPDRVHRVARPCA